MSLCYLCRSANVTNLLDCGMQPISNRFLASPSEEEFTHPIVMGQCEACGLVQLIKPPPASELRPRHAWVAYNEPEQHLDQLAELVSNFPGLSSESSICGVSFKDDSLLERLKKKGFQHTWRIDPERDLGIGDPGAGVEMIQERLGPEKATALAQGHGKSEVVIARQILEHAHSMCQFMEALKRLVGQGGYLVVEVPDCSRGLDKLDYSTVWEEHVVYFTPETFTCVFGFGGFSLVRFEKFPYPLEDSLIGIARPQEQREKPVFPPGDILELERQRATAFSDGLTRQRTKFQKFLAEYRRNKGKIAFFGAGHLACTFINLLGLRDYVEFVVDDHPKKKGLFMPGSRLPIRGSAALLEKGIKMCLLSLNPDNEDKVIQNNRRFIEQGGTFSSIFRVSKYALSV